MRKVSRTVLTLLLGVLLAAATAEEDSQGNRRSRNYSKRRYYTKKIDFDKPNTPEELSIPEESPEKDDGVARDYSPKVRMDMSSDFAPRPMPEPAMPPARGEDDSTDWLVKALMEARGTAEEPSATEGKAALWDSPESSNWGWLAEEVRTVSAKDSARNGEYLSGESEFEIFLNELENRDQLAAFVTSMEDNEYGSSTNAAAEHTPFRNLEQEIRERYEVFGQTEDESKDAGGPTPAAEQEAQANNSLQTLRGSLLEETGLTEDSLPDLDIPYNRNDGFSVAARPEADRGIDRRQYSEYSRASSPSHSYGNSAVDDNTGTFSSYGSAFDNVAGSRFKSPFETESSYGSSYQNRDSYSYSRSSLSDRPSSRARPSSYSPAPSDSLGTGSGLETFEHKTQKTPHSINQWD